MNISKITKAPKKTLLKKPVKKTAKKATTPALTMGNVPTIEIRQKPESTGISTGGNTELFIDGERMRSVRSLSLNVDARGVAELSLTMVGRIVSGKKPVKKTKNK